MLRSLLPKKLRLLRKKSHLRQEDVARKLNLERSTYCNYENGSRMPSLETAVLLADFYQVPVDYLLREDNIHDMDTELYPLSLPEKNLILLFRELPADTQKEWVQYSCYRLAQKD